MEKIKKERPEKYNGKLSLYPLKFEEAVKNLLVVKPHKDNKNSKNAETE
jgi:hypothetical protein